MPRKKEEVITEEESVLSEKALLGLCNADSAIIRLGRLMAQKASIDVKDAPRLESSKKTSLIEESALKAWEKPLESDMVLYLNARASGATTKEACEILGFDRTMPMLWQAEEEKDGVYSQCLKAIDDMRTQDLDDVMWKQALEDKASAILKMFTIKSRIDAYKDNAPPQAQMQTNIHVTIDGNRFEVDTALKEIGEG
jgi:hypothetical protein